MIYLFCNEHYGNSFIKSIRQYQSTKCSLRVTIVFSSKTEASKSKLKSCLRSVVEKPHSMFTQFRKKSFHGLPVLIVKDINQPRFYNKVSREDIGIIAGFNQIFKDTAINKFKRVFNFHPSLLPFYRGPVPSYWCIQNREVFTGYTLHEVTARIDDGNILYQDVVEIGDIRSEHALDRQIACKAASKLMELLDHVMLGLPFNIQKVDAGKLYEHHVDYLSFPKS
jgi:methionyl-tRNA formyltransferase